eukprot:1160105-Pelagomonas_calceolata.AAC.2
MDPHLGELHAPSLTSGVGGPDSESSEQRPALYMQTQLCKHIPFSYQWCSRACQRPPGGAGADVAVRGRKLPCLGMAMAAEVRAPAANTLITAHEEIKDQDCFNNLI